MIKTFLKLSLLPLMVLFFFFSCEPEETTSSSHGAENAIHGTWERPSYTADVTDFTSHFPQNALSSPIVTTNTALSNAIATNATILLLTTVEREELTLNSSQEATITIVNANGSLILSNAAGNGTIPLLNNLVSFPKSSVSGTFTFTDTQIIFIYNPTTGTGLYAEEASAEAITTQYELSEDENTLTLISGEERRSYTRK